ncbi:Cytochrome P450 [Macrophomina phaseolina MS6]|uniref:Cytochrome P450 n=1 Tax=Macrophomina phaseolina (strain MS6) TaxID=1126212 RepID=K2RIK7_MACPH|nr:Cytochrome P450 [Macrophomina phaseolina MS6]
MDEVDFVGTFIEMFEGKYTTLGNRSRLHPRVVKVQLNRHLADVMVGIQDEIIDAFKDSFPTCDDWTEVPVVDCITQIVARVSGRMFGGTELSRNREWVQTSIDFAHDSFNAAQKLKKFPGWLRPVVAQFLPAIRRIRSRYRAAERAAVPLLDAREKSGESAFDLLYWMKEQGVGGEKDHGFLAGILLIVSFAAIHTSAAAPSQLIYDLCQHPECIEPLRAEARKAMDEQGKITKSGFMQLPLLDSIMKESQRFNPLLLSEFFLPSFPDRTLTALATTSHLRAHHHQGLAALQRLRPPRPHADWPAHQRHRHGPQALPGPGDVRPLAFQQDAPGRSDHGGQSAVCVVKPGKPGLWVRPARLPWVSFSIFLFRPASVCI